MKFIKILFLITCASMVTCDMKTKIKKAIPLMLMKILNKHKILPLPIPILFSVPVKSHSYIPYHHPPPPLLHPIQPMFNKFHHVSFHHDLGNSHFHHTLKSEPIQIYKPTPIKTFEFGYGDQLFHHKTLPLSDYTFKYLEDPVLSDDAIIAKLNKPKKLFLEDDFSLPDSVLKTELKSSLDWSSLSKPFIPHDIKISKSISKPIFLDDSLISDFESELLNKPSLKWSKLSKTRFKSKQVWPKTEFSTVSFSDSSDIIRHLRNGFKKYPKIKPIIAHPVKFLKSPFSSIEKPVFHPDNIPITFSKSITFGGKSLLPGSHIKNEKDLFSEENIKGQKSLLAGGGIKSGGSLFAGSEIKSGRSLYSGDGIKSGGFLFPAGKIKGSGSLFSGSKIKSGGSLFSGGEIKSSGSLFSGGGFKSSRSLFSGGKTKSGGSSFSGSEIKNKGFLLATSEIKNRGSLLSANGFKNGRTLYSGSEIKNGGPLFYGGGNKNEGSLFYGRGVKSDGSLFSGSNIKNRGSLFSGSNIKNSFKPIASSKIKPHSLRPKQVAQPQISSSKPVVWHRQHHEFKPSPNTKIESLKPNLSGVRIRPRNVKQNRH